MKTITRILMPTLLASSVSAFASPGDVDATFGTEGHTTTPAQETVLQPGDPAVDSQGRIYVPVYAVLDNGGLPLPVPYAVIVRLTASGALDPTFGTDGILAMPASTHFTPMGIAIDEDQQRLIVSGAVDIGLGFPTTAAVARIDFAGALDPTFGSAGIARPSVVNAISQADAVDLLDDGRILVASTDGGSIAISRLLADGSVDHAFGTDGRTGLIASSAQQLVSVIRHDADGAIFACGPRSFRNGSPGVEFPDNGVRIGRLTADGVPTPGFGDGGSMEVDLDGNASCTDLRPGQEGAFSVAATTTSSLLIARFHADGSRDLAFNTTGLESGPYPTVTPPTGRALDDGRLILARSGGAIHTLAGDIAIFSPPGAGGIEVTRVSGSPEMGRSTGGPSGGGGDGGGGGGGAFDSATVTLLLLVALWRGRRNTIAGDQG